jgi:hypothetical protein
LAREGNRRGVIVYLEYQVVCPFVATGSSPSLPSEASVSPSLDATVEGDEHPLPDEEVEDPIQTTGQKTWHSVYFVGGGGGIVYVYV